MFTEKLNFRRISILFSLTMAFSLVSCDSKTETTDDTMIETVEVEKSEESDENKMVDSNEDVADMDVIYTVAEVDMQPLFDVNCANMDQPIECSNEKLLKFIQDNTEYPKRAKFEGQDGFEQVVVVVEKDGSLSDLKYVASSQSKDCDGCQKAAVDVVGKMKNWKPGMKDGKPVAVQMTIPVKFESI